jgi:hypothetical protein
MRPPEETSSALYDGQAKGLLEFLDYVKAKGMLAGRTADAYKSACFRVLAIDREDWTTTDVRSLDIEHQMDRYIRLQGASAKPASLKTYRQRLRAAIGLYRGFLANPTGFRGPTTKRRPRASAERATNKTLDGQSKAASDRDHGSPRATTEVAPSLVTYPFPLRSGMMGYLQLPRNLAASDVRRLCTFLESLAIDEFSEENAG